MTFDTQWVEIFRVGDYGPKGKWTREMLAQAVANFRAGAWKPPAVLGHPEDDSPAMAWVEELQLDGDVLKARFGQVQPELAAHVQSGRFPNRSAAFYLNPQNSGPVLRHVGFLGAMPPEVKGLAPIRFSASEFVEFDIKERGPMNTLPSVNLVAAAAVLGRDVSDPATVKLHDRAEQIARERGLHFGEALRSLRSPEGHYEGQVLSNGMVVTGVELSNRINSVIREARINGATLSYSEAQQIVKTEERLDALEKLGRKTATFSDGSIRMDFSEVPQEQLKAALGYARNGRFGVDPASVERDRAARRVQLAAAKRGTKMEYPEALRLADSMA